jgi:rubrerythrin
VRAVEESGLRTYTAISVAVMMTEDAVKNTLAKCIKGGYLEGLVMGVSGLEPLRSEATDTAFVECEYCGTVISAGEAECPSCGAKVNK